MPAHQPASSPQPRAPQATRRLTLVAEAKSASTPRPHLTAVRAEPSNATPSPLPVSEGFVQSLAVVVFEVIEGVRAVRQLGNVLTLQAARQLSEYRQARQDQRKIVGGTARAVRHVGRVRIDHPGPTVAEAAVVLHLEHRARAVAVRLEWEHARWRLTDIAVI